MDDSLTKWVVGTVAMGILALLGFLARVVFASAERRAAEREAETAKSINDLRADVKVLSAQMVAGNDRIAAKIEELAARSHQLEGRLNMGNQTFDELRKTDSRQWEELKELKSMVLSLFRRAPKAKTADE